MERSFNLNALKEERTKVRQSLIVCLRLAQSPARLFPIVWRIVVAWIDQAGQDANQGWRKNLGHKSQENSAQNQKLFHIVARSSLLRRGVYLGCVLANRLASRVYKKAMTMPTRSETLSELASEDAYAATDPPTGWNCTQRGSVL